jgi:serine/threonine protein kinase
MFGRDGQIRLCDFGVSTSVRPKEIEHQEVGSLAYQAPEVYKRNYNKQCDIWSLGVTIYQMITGILPFDEKRDGRGYMIKYIKSGTFPKLPDNVSDDLKDLIKGMLTTDY